MFIRTILDRVVSQYRRVLCQNNKCPYNKNFKCEYFLFWKRQPNIKANLFEDGGCLSYKTFLNKKFSDKVFRFGYKPNLNQLNDLCVEAVISACEHDLDLEQAEYFIREYIAGELLNYRYILIVVGSPMEVKCIIAFKHKVYESIVEIEE